MQTPPRVIPADPSAIWSLGMPPEIMTGFMVNFLREHFLDATHIVDPTFRDRIWKADPRQVAWTDSGSPILIESIDRFDPNLIEARPALIVKDHGWKPTRMGIANKHMWTNPGDGTSTFACLYQSAITVFAIAGESKEAKKLSTEVLRQIIQFEDVIRCELRLVRFMVVERGDCFKIEESTANSAVPISIAYMAEETWALKPQAARVKRIVFNMTANAGG